MLMLRVFNLLMISEMKLPITVSLDAPWVLFGSSEGSESADNQTKQHTGKMPIAGGQDYEMRTAFRFGCDGAQMVKKHKRQV